jgi:hypothetical protein
MNNYIQLQGVHGKLHWWKEFDIINVQYHNWRVQFYYPIVKIDRTGVKITLDCIFGIRTKYPRRTKYLAVYLLLFGFGIAIEYHEVTEEYNALSKLSYPFNPKE